MAKTREGGVPAKQRTARRTASGGAGGTEVMPQVVAGGNAPVAPVVHNVVLGGDGGGQPVNLLELLMEEQTGGERTTAMELPGRMPASGRANGDLTAPMMAVGGGHAAAPSEFTALVQTFQPSAVGLGRVPTEADRPRAGGPTPSRAGEFTSLVEGLLDPSAGSSAGSVSGQTRAMDVASMSGVSGSVGGGEPTKLSRAEGVSSVEKVDEPVLGGAARTKAPEADVAAASSSFGVWVPRLLAVIAVELLAILMVLLMERKH